jgi:hypothetical protein
VTFRLENPVLIKKCLKIQTLINEISWPFSETLKTFHPFLFSLEIAFLVRLTGIVEKW